MLRGPRIFRLLFSRSYLEPTNERNLMKRIFERILNEPVLVIAVVLAVGNLVGHDLTAFAGFIETVVVIVAGFVARHFVTPVRHPNLG